MIDRRTVLTASLGCAAGLASTAAVARAHTEIWTFDRLSRIGGLRPRLLGAPKLVPTPFGRGTVFDGIDDAVFVDRHPLAGAARFTFEALFRPDGGAFEQRWFHLESHEGPNVQPGQGNTRMLFEIRVVDGHWYLDTFVKGPGYSQALIVPDRLFPLQRWHHVAQTYDGATYRSYVNGQLQAEAAVPFRPQGPGRASIGMRMNRVNPFHGAIRQAAFTRGAALTPGTFRLRGRKT